MYDLTKGFLAHWQKTHPGEPLKLNSVAKPVFPPLMVYKDFPTHERIEPVMTNNERDTHFANAAKLLYERLAQNVVHTQRRHFAEHDLFMQEQHTIIAQFAYDLAVHAICAYDETPRDFAIEMIEHIPDLTEWPTKDKR